jgi:hypothetical protein
VLRWKRQDHGLVVPRYGVVYLILILIRVEGAGATLGNVHASRRYCKRPLSVRTSAPRRRALGRGLLVPSPRYEPSMRLGQGDTSGGSTACPLPPYPPPPSQGARLATRSALAR